MQLIDLPKVSLMIFFFLFFPFVSIAGILHSQMLCPVRVSRRGQQ